MKPPQTLVVDDPRPSRSPQTEFSSQSEPLTEQENRLLRVQRIECISSLTNGVAHDLNNALAPILMFADLLSETLQDPQHRSTVQMIKASTQRATNLIRQLTLYSRGVTEPVLDLDLRRHAQEALRLMRGTFPKSIRFVVRLPDSLWTVRGDPVHWQQLLLNLCLFARDAMPQGGTLTIEAQNLELDEALARSLSPLPAGPCVRLTISGTGPGIPPESLSTIFEPVVPTKPGSEGTRLQLASAWRIVTAHGGHVAGQSQPGCGAAFQIHVPANRLPANPPSEAEAMPPKPGHGQCLLFVDDEELLRFQSRSWLEARGYRVLTASDGFEALSVYCRHQDMIDAVLLDLAMPYLDGEATMRELRKLDSTVPIILMSGAADFDSQSGRFAHQAQACLAKPWEPNDMLRVLNRLFNAKAEAL